MSGVGVIIGMATVAVASSYAESVMTERGKIDEAKNVSLFTKCTLAGTGIAGFVTFLKMLRGLI